MEYTSRFLIAQDAAGKDYPALAFKKEGVEVIIDLCLMGICTHHYPSGATPSERVHRMIDCEWRAAAEAQTVKAA